MKFLISIILTALLSCLLQMFLPWWSLVISAFAIGSLVSQSGLLSFISGFIGSGIVWFIYAEMMNEPILSEKIAELFHAGSPMTLILIGSLIAAFTGGFAALSGNALRKLFS